MQFKNRIICHPGNLVDIPEDDIIRHGCISICDAQHVEQMIFLLPVNNPGNFEVRIYKANATDYYVPNKCDLKLKMYKSNDEFASFIFDDLLYARHFISVLGSNHPEYKIRPSSISKEGVLKQDPKNRKI